MAGSDQCDYEKMTQGLGSEYEVVNNIAIKPYSSCRWQHATLDCVKQLREEHGLKAEDVGEVVIHSFAWVCTHELYGPADMVDAQFCIPYTVTMVLLGFHPGPAWYTQENLESKDILDLSKKVRVELDPELDRAYFERDQLSARLQITTKGGETLETYVEIPRGYPRNPLTSGEIEDKFRNQALYSLEEDEVEEAMRAIYDFENLDSVSDLMSLLAG
jgi:2-methylcitrate dehydratase PrpD